MTGIERVKDVEQRLELPAQYQEAVEKLAERLDDIMQI